MELHPKAVMRMNEPTPISVIEVPLPLLRAKTLPRPNLPLDSHLLLPRPPTQRLVLRRQARHPNIKKPLSGHPLSSRLPQARLSRNVRIWTCRLQTTQPRHPKMAHPSSPFCLETANNIAVTTTSVRPPDRPRGSPLPVLAPNASSHSRTSLTYLAFQTDEILLEEESAAASPRDSSLGYTMSTK